MSMVYIAFISALRLAFLYSHTSMTALGVPRDLSFFSKKYENCPFTFSLPMT